jgi:hypothetical protein
MMFKFEFGHIVNLLASFWVVSRELRIIYNAFLIYKAEVFRTQTRIVPVQNSSNA